MVFFFFFYIGPSKIYAFLPSMLLSFLPFFFLLLLVSTFFVPIPFLFLYHPIRSKALPERDLYHLRLMTYIVGSFTPGRLGEFSIFYFIKKRYRVDILPSLYTFVLDKAITVAHTLFFSIIALLVLFKQFTTAVYFFLALFAFVTLFLGLHRFMNKIARIASNLLRIKRIQTFFTSAGDFSKKYLRLHSSFILLNFFLTFLFQLLISTISKTTFAAFSIQIPFFTIFLVNTLLTLTSFIPLNFFGFGAKEVTSIYIYTTVGVPAEVTLSSIIIFLVFRFIIYVCYALSKDLSFIKMPLRPT